MAACLGRGRIGLREIAEMKHRRGMKIAVVPRALHFHRDGGRSGPERKRRVHDALGMPRRPAGARTSTRLELQSLMRISYAVFCSKKQTHYSLTSVHTHSHTM